MAENEKPLVTFALFSYNQERFIREAVEGALAQTYSPLQIVLSDDCSSDRTFEIMREMVGNYDGSHEILLNRNEQNLGIGGHINRMMELTRGELIVVAAGDDISLPTRVSTLTRRWLAKDEAPDLLCSDYIKIDGTGREGNVGIGCILANMQPESMAANGHGILGATAAWTKRLWGRFHGLPRGAVHEDQILPFRAALFGGIEYVSTPLVKYRQGVSTWLSRYNTADVAEMRRRTEMLTRNAIITASIQLQDAVALDRFDLVAPIIQRLVEKEVIHAIYTRRISPLKALLEATRNKAKIRLVSKALVQVYIPFIYAYVLKYRAQRLNENRSMA